MFLIMLENIAFSIIIALFSGLILISAMGCRQNGQAGGTMQTTVSAAKYDIPQDQKTRWEGITTTIERQNKDCRDACGKSDACFSKCDKAFKSMLDREYKKLIYEEKAK